MYKFCINLDRRTDRWDNVSKIFLQHGLSVYRWSAIDAKKYGISGHKAGIASHITLLQFAKTMNIDKMIIFEDDVILCDNFVSKLNTIIDHLPTDWEILSLHSFKSKNIPINEYIVKLSSIMHGAHGLLLNRDGIRKVLESDHRKCIESIYYESVKNLYGVSLQHTLAFQTGLDSDIPETSTINEYKNFYEKYKNMYS